MTPLLILLPLLLSIAVASAAILRWQGARRVRVRIEVARSRALGLPVAAPGQRRSLVACLVGMLGAAITSSHLLSARTRLELEQTLRAGGLATAHNLELFVGSKIVLALAAPAGTFLLLRHDGMKPMLFLGAVAGAGVLGLMLPNMIIGQRRKTTLAAIDRGLADGLDMMVICAEAGLALEATLQRVGVEIVHAHPKLAAELSLTSNELGLASDPRAALTNMGIRTGLPSLARLATALVQSLQYGTPLSAALRALATELRQETLTRFEERAARLPVLLTIPMILFILPCVFLIVAGPIVVQVFRTLNR